MNNSVLVWIGIGTLSLAVLAHVITAVWWASRIDTTLSFLQLTITALNNMILKHDVDRYTSQESAKDFALRDQRLDAMWEDLDYLKKQKEKNHG